MQVLYLFALLPCVNGFAPRLPAAPIGRQRTNLAAADGLFDEAAVRDEAKQTIKDLIGRNKVMLFMKGSKLFPQCGFSNTAVSILRALDQDFDTFDVLSDMVVRDEIKKHSNWPTIPQCYIDGEFVGGSDILLEMYESGELEKLLGKANA